MHIGSKAACVHNQSGRDGIAARLVRMQSSCYLLSGLPVTRMCGKVTCSRQRGLSKCCT